MKENDSTKKNNDLRNDKALGLALGQIQKDFGKGSIMWLGDRGTAVEAEVIPTGNLAVDMALGIGGVPKGRVVEIFGPEMSGKTTLTLHLVAEAQKQGGRAAFIDAEHALDPSYARKLGVDIDNLLISQPDCGEQALEITDILVKSGALSIIVIDSVAALVPRAELEGEMGDTHVGLQARLMSQALRKLTSSINKSRTAVLFTNQLREKVGIMFGNPEVTPGGRALKFYSSIRIDIRKLAVIKVGDQVIGNRARISVVKNKMAPPFRKVEVEIIYNEGISRVGSLIELGVNAGIISKLGTWYSYGDERIGQGRENVKAFLKEYPDTANEIETKIKQKYGLIPTEEEDSAETEKEKPIKDRAVTG